MADRRSFDSDWDYEDSMQPKKQEKEDYEIDEMYEDFE